MFKHLRGSGFLFFVFLLSSFSKSTPTKLSPAAFINQNLAHAKMVNDLYGIPISVCLGQSMHESGSGNSYLVVEGQNFFGMKCKEPGEVGIYHQDDEVNKSCFRIYECAAQSFMDYGGRLGTHKYYAPLQKLIDNNETDHRVWLRTILDCGYATDTNYVHAVSKLIEANQLTKYDKPVDKDPLLQEDEPQTDVVVSINVAASAVGYSEDTHEQDLMAQLLSDSLNAHFSQPLHMQEISTQFFVPQPVFGDQLSPLIDFSVRIYSSPPMLHPLHSKKPIIKYRSITIR
jgi:Mannosyl-glycoprotein endo-beta-N-acetylglucosaminidase